MNALEIEEAVVELIRTNSTIMPPDVVSAIRSACEREEAGTSAKQILSDIITNIDMAEDRTAPVCQDTGYLAFHVYYQTDRYSGNSMSKLIREAVSIATAKSYLRRNTVDTISGDSVSDNVSGDVPRIHFHPILEGPLMIRLIQKGGGCENVSTQYALPDQSMGVGRSLEGAYRVIMDAVVNAQGRGCAPGILGVCIGGDREMGYHIAKEQLFRKIDDYNTDPTLGELETRILNDANALGIGPMGMGGKTTLLDVKIGGSPRIPASYFVTISYNCWALRRRTLTIHEGGYDID